MPHTGKLYCLDVDAEERDDRGILAYLLSPGHISSTYEASFSDHFSEKHEIYDHYTVKMSTGLRCIFFDSSSSGRRFNWQTYLLYFYSNLTRIYLELEALNRAKDKLY